MDCEKSLALMMKQIDKAISEKEYAALKKHLAECESCKIDFELYESISAELAMSKMEEAPEGFELAVMMKIESLNLDKTSVTQKVNNFTYIVWGVFSIVFGLGSLLIANRDGIMDYLASTSYFGSYIETVRPLNTFVTEMFDGLVTMIGSFFANVSALVYSARYLTFGIVCALIVAAYFVYRKSDSIDKAEIK